MGFSTRTLLATILFIAMALVLAQAVYSQDIDDDHDDQDMDMDDDHDDQDFANALYNNLSQGSGRLSRFLGATTATKGEPKAGAMCDKRERKVENICDGILTNNGTTLLLCCNNRCRSILDDTNNCGKCNRKCAFRRVCCTGRCINVSRNKNNCGGCGMKCKKGRRCEKGICGYA